jgi:hypothetical protein
MVLRMAASPPANADISSTISKWPSIPWSIRLYKVKLSNDGGGDSHRPQTLTQCFSFMDGFPSARIRLVFFLT